MRNKHIRDAFRYCFDDLIRVLATTCGIYTLVCIALWILELLFPENVHVTSTDGGAIAMSYVITIVITMFVAGIVGVREYLRMLVQHGKSRKTAMLAYFLAAAAATGCAMALFFLIYIGEVIVTALYFHPLPLIALIIALVMLNAMLWGSAISLAFWRLPKKRKIIGAVGLPILLIFLLNASDSSAVAGWMFSSFGSIIAMLAAALLLAAVIDYLLARRAAITAAQ